MISSFFTGVGSKKLIDIDKIMKMPLWKRKKELDKAIEWNTAVAKDYHGFAFFAATDQFVAIAVGQILQLPEINAVYLRESQSQMYSPSAFFLSKWLISTLVYMLEPIVYGTLSFYSVEVGEVTHYEYREFMAISILLALTASSFGYLFSTLFSNDQVALQIHNGCWGLLYFCSPVFTLIGNRRNIIVDILEPISPFTYACELYLRCFLRSSSEKARVLEFFGYTKGEEACYFNLAAIGLTYFFLSWVTTEIKARIRL